VYHPSPRQFFYKIIAHSYFYIFRAANIKIAQQIIQNMSLKLQYILLALYIYAMILVTGGTGLVGSHLLLRLTQEGKTVKAIYRKKEKIQRVEELFAFAKAHSLFSKITWVKADITDIPELTTAFEDVEIVYHCAAFISFDPYQFDNLIKTNVEGTANVVNLCLANSIKKLCYVSTIATLGKLPNNPVDEDNHWDPNDDNSVYAISKYGAETEVWRGSQEGLDVIIFNPGIILGEGPIEEGSGIFFDRIVKGAAYYPSGGSAFIDVKDLVLIMIEGMHSMIKNERYVTIGDNSSFKEVFYSIARAMTLKPPKKVFPNALLNTLAALDSFVGIFRRKRNLTRNMIKALQETNTYENTKIKNDFSFSPTPLEDTISRVYLYHNTKR
jgi:nucleoside-diphosphate-sugar epimerase